MSEPQPPASRRLWVWFALTTIIPAMSLGWLGWRMADQDRTLQQQHRQEARNQAVELAATALQGTVAELEERLATASAGSPVPPGSFHAGAALVAFASGGVIDRGGTSLPYYALVPSAANANLDLFVRADELEFQRHDSAGAIQLLSGLSRSKDPAVRGEALMRLARNARKLGDTVKALAAFDDLIALDAVHAGGWPAGLAGHQGRALLFADINRQSDLAAEARLLSREIEEGRWLLTRAQYEFSAQQARAWLTDQPPPAPDPDSIALASAAEAVWTEWQASGRSEVAIRRRQTLWVDDRSVLVLTRSSPERLVVLLAGSKFLDQAWRDRMRSAAGRDQMDFALSDAEGRAVLGQPSVPLSIQSVRPASATQLPWTVHAISPAGGPGVPLSGPVRLMLAAILAMTVVVITGGYFINRAMAREIRVARLQSDFAATVSHEFRTPLTTLRHLSELLVRGRVSSDARRQEFYLTLLRESQRLHRLVEGLLNFARLESGQLEYQFDVIDPAAFVRDVVIEFEAEAGERGRRVECHAGEGVPPIRADREMLARVLWNLLDNAVKYSPEGRTVRVELASSERGAIIRVHDEGAGIPASEQMDIFRRFVRGSTAKAGAIKGTGIGLAMAKEIVHAHGGDITVRSEPGQGSTFSVVLPAVDASDQLAHTRTA